MRKHFRLAGEGGQGLITAGIILAAAAAEYTSYNAAQTQSYGPESRGGASKADVIISDEDIDYPEMKTADYLVVMAQEAWDKYSDSVLPGGTIIVDSTYVKTCENPQINLIEYPISVKAKELGREIVANIVALGLLTGISGLIPDNAVRQAVLQRVPKGTEELNKRAFSAGIDGAKAINAKGGKSR